MATFNTLSITGTSIPTNDSTEMVTVTLTTHDAVQHQGSANLTTETTGTSPGPPSAPASPRQFLPQPDATRAAVAGGAATADDVTTSQLDGRYERVVSVKAAPFNATGNGTTDDTKAIQAAIDYATSINAATFFPSSGKASYRVSQLVIPAGAILEGVSSGTYPDNEAIAGVSTLARLGGTNKHLLLIPDGNNYCRIRDIQIDGNKENNKVSGDGIHIGDQVSDATVGQEAQVIIERCYVHDNPGHNIYLGYYRRANKVLNSVCNYANMDGICVAGSDNTVMHNICGTNGRAGINLGTTKALNWNPDEAAHSAAVTHVIGNDIYQNRVGINVSSDSWGNVISSNGIDRNLKEGVAVNDGNMPATIHANVFHSNGTEADNAYPHIGLGLGLGTVQIAANIFGPQDAGINKRASYGVYAASPLTSVYGDLGILDADPTRPDSKSTNNGLVYAAPGVWASTRGDCLGVWTAADQGLIAWTEDPAMAADSSQVPAGGVLYVRRVRVPTACIVTNVLMSVTEEGASLSNCYAALFREDGTRFAGSADQSNSGSNWSSGTGIKTVPLGGPHQITAGDYYIGIIANGTRLPSLACGNGQAATMANVGLSPDLPRIFRTATGSSGNTSVPPVMGKLSASSHSFWMALS